MSNTLLVYILDESGSMQNIKDITISKFSEELQGLPKDCFVTLLRFNTGDHYLRYSYESLHFDYEGKPAADVVVPTYIPNNGTPLYDAIGFALENTDNWLAKEATFGRTYKVMAAIHTDGQENASVKFKKDQIKQMIETRKATGFWDFLYLGVGENAWIDPTELGIDSTNSQFVPYSNAGAAMGASYISSRTTDYSKTA